jgi:putative ATPase
MWAWPIRGRWKSRVAAHQACHMIGMPECTVHLTQAVVYLALAPKSNALYTAYETAKRTR